MKNVENSYIYNNSLQYKQDDAHNVATKAQPSRMAAPAIQLPDLYYDPNENYKKKSFLETLKKIDIMGLITPFFEHPIGILGTWFAMSFGMDKFNEACRGEYEKSLIAKAAKFGDKISDLKPFKSKAFNKTTSGIAKGWNKLITKTKEKSGVVRAFIDTPAKPTHPAAKSIMFNEKAELVGDLTHILDTLGIKSSNDAVNRLSNECMDLKNLDIRKTEIPEIEKFFGNKLKDIKSEELINYVNLKHLGTDEQAIRKILASPYSSFETKQEILKKMGVEFKDILEWQKEPEKYFEQAKKATENIRGLSVQKGNSKIFGKLFNRKLGIDGINNKMKSVTKDGAKSALGRFNAKAVQRLYRGITWGNGKLGALLFVSPMLMHTFKNTKDAGKDQKIGTAAWGLIDSFIWVITFGLSAKLLYHTAGIRNAGMKKEAVQKIENIKNAFNEKFLGGQFASKEAAIQARKIANQEIKALRNVEGQNLLTRMMRSIVAPLSKDLNMMKGVTFWQKVGNKAQNCISMPLKFILVMMVIDSKLRDILHKACNSVFGKDYDSYMTEEHNELKKAQKEFTHKDLTQRLYATQKAKMEAKNNLVVDQNKEKDIAAAPLPVFSKDNLFEKTSESSLQKAVPTATKIDTEDKETKTQIIENKNDVFESQSNISKEPTQNIEQQKTTKSKLTNEIEEKPIEESKTIAEIPKSEIEMSIERPKTIAEIPEPAIENTIEPQNKPIVENKTDKQNSIQNTTPKDMEEDVISNQTYVPNATNSIAPKKKADNYTYIPSSKNVIQSSEENSQNKKKYIPSQNIANLTKNFDNSGLSKVLKRADRAEQQAIQILSGNFSRI